MTGVAIVSAGSRHTMIIKNDKTLWATGRNQEGQLGDGTTTSKSTPVEIMSEVSAVSASKWGSAPGGGRSMILRTDGTLMGTGDNQAGEIGDGTRTGRSTPVQVMTGVSWMSAGVQHTMMVKSDGVLWGVGWNSNGQLGDGTTVMRLSPIAINVGN